VYSKGIDIIIPTYNSIQLLDQLILHLQEWKKNTQIKPHFVFVDDGSKDGTFEKLKAILPASGLAYSLIGISENVGQHSAILTGYRQSKHAYVATIDDDLQHDPFQLEVMLDAMKREQADLVYGNYLVKKHHGLRNLGTYILQGFLRFTTDIDYSGVTSFRIFKRDVLKVLQTGNDKIHFIEDYLIRGAKKRINVEVEHQKGIRDKSNYSFLKLVQMAFIIVVLHSSFPLRFISRLGLGMSFFCFALGLYYLWQKLYFDVALGFTSIIVSIFFSTGLLLFSIGVVGDFLRRIWVQNQGLNAITFEVYTDEEHLSD